MGEYRGSLPSVLTAEPLGLTFICLPACLSCVCRNVSHVVLHYMYVHIYIYMLPIQNDIGAYMNSHTSYWYLCVVFMHLLLCSCTYETCSQMCPAAQLLKSRAAGAYLEVQGTYNPVVSAVIATYKPLKYPRVTNELEIQLQLGY